MLPLTPSKLLTPPCSDFSIMCSTGGTPQKNTASFFESPYNQENTPKKVLNNIEITASEVLKVRG